MASGLRILSRSSCRKLLELWAAKRGLAFGVAPTWGLMDLPKLSKRYIYIYIHRVICLGASGVTLYANRGLYRSCLR